MKERIVVCVLTIIFIGGMAWASGYEVTEFPVVTNEEVQYPVVSGNTIAWVQTRPEETNLYGIFGYDVPSHTTSLIHSRPTRLEDISFGGDVLAWRDYRYDTADVWGYNRSTQTEIPISTGVGAQYYAGVSEDGSRVFYQAPLGEKSSLYGYDVGSETECLVSGNVMINDSGDPSSSGNCVVWRDFRNGNYDVYGYDLDSDTEFPICTTSADQGCQRVSGSTVVWSDDRGVMGYNLVTHTEFFIAEGGQPDISGNTVVFTSSDWNIYGYNLLTETTYPICTADGLQRDPRICGDVVAWNDYRSGSKDIYGAVVIPEPTTLCLLGLGALGLFRRKR